MKLLWVITSVVFLNVSCVAQHKPGTQHKPQVEQSQSVNLTTDEYQPTADQAKEWDHLYPKLNSKMARMEQLMNRMERFLGSADLKETSLGHCIEFTHLARQSVCHANDYMEGAKAEAFSEALEQVAELGGDLHALIKSDNITQAKAVLSELGSIRRQSHSKYVY